MSEETDATIGGAEAEVAAAAVENNSEATTEQQTEAEQTGQADDTGEVTEEAHTKRVPWFQKRIDEVTSQKYAAQREADYWRGMAEGRSPQPTQQQQVGPPDRWEDPDGYDRWLIGQAANLAREEAAQQQRYRTFEEREAAVKASKPDYDAVVRDPSLPISPLMADIIRDSERGAEVAYYLGTNRAEAQQIHGLPPHLQAKALGLIEAKLSPQQAQTRTPPPPPPKTVGGISAGLGKSFEDMSMAEYIAARSGDRT